MSFNPEHEGKLEENLILACDNQTSEFYKLTGYGAMMDLDIIAVDGKEVNFKENPFDKASLSKKGNALSLSLSHLYFPSKQSLSNDRNP